MDSSLDQRCSFNSKAHVQCITPRYSSNSARGIFHKKRKGEREKPWREMKQQPGYPSGSGHSLQISSWPELRAHTEMCLNTAASLVFLGQYYWLLHTHTFCTCLPLFQRDVHVKIIKNKHPFERMVEFMSFCHHEYSQLMDPRWAGTVLCRVRWHLCFLASNQGPHFRTGYVSKN